jgi:hypothetical protein
VIAVCGFNVNQLVVTVGVAKNVTAPLGLEMVKACDTFAPPDWAEKVIDVLSTVRVWACRPAAASTPKIRQETEKVRFNVNLQIYAVRTGRTACYAKLLARRGPFRYYPKNIICQSCFIFNRYRELRETAGNP